MDVTQRRPAREAHNGRTAEVSAPIADIEIERALLGSCAINPAVLDDLGRLSRSVFFDERHARLWEHIEAAPPEIVRDPALFTRHLMTRGDLHECGGPAYLAEVLSAAPHSYNATYYAEILTDLAERRRLQATATQLAEAVGDRRTPLDTLRQRAAELTQAAGPVERKVPEFARLVSSAELSAERPDVRYLVPEILAERQPCVIGGRSKCLKTSLAIDLAISLGTGTPFLDRFEIPEPCRVAVWSGESGETTIRETAIRVAASKGVELADADVLWSFALPKLGVAGDLLAIGDAIEKHGVRVAIVDPLYLALTTPGASTKPSDLFAMGSLLGEVTALGASTGCTMLVLHHFRKNGQTSDDDPCPLEELSQAGVGEWARQWLLLQRRSPYQADGRHELWMRTGGSAGHAGLWAVDVAEGLRSGPGGRCWSVEVQGAASARDEARRQRESAKAAEQERAESEHVERIRDVLRDRPEGDTQSALAKAAGLNGTNAQKALATLRKRGEIEDTTVRKGSQTYSGVRLRLTRTPGHGSDTSQTN